MFKRIIQKKLISLSRQYPVVTVTGPRQSGKTTLCQQSFPDKPYVNLESPDIREFAQTDPRGFLSNYPQGAVLDEVQRVPELTSYLQAIVDKTDQAGQYILTGSQQFEVMSTITQTLAGRTGLLKLLPLGINEIYSKNEFLTGQESIEKLMYTGFYPRIYKSKLSPTQFYGDYLETYVERDIRQLSTIKDLNLFTRFVKLCAGRVGQLLNLSSLGNDVGVSHTTARQWITLLEASYIIFQLPPWHVNLSKRQIKSTKLYFYDVGLASYLLGAESPTHLLTHPLKGNLFENLIVMETLKSRYHRGLRSNLYFWRDAKGNEVDLLLEKNTQLYPIEIKAGATIHNDFFKGCTKFKNRLKQHQAAPIIVYGGEQSQIRSLGQVFNLNDYLTNFLYS